MLESTLKLRREDATLDRRECAFRLRQVVGAADPLEWLLLVICYHELGGGRALSAARQVLRRVAGEQVRVERPIAFRQTCKGVLVDSPSD